MRERLGRLALLLLCLCLLAAALPAAHSALAEGGKSKSITRKCQFVVSEGSKRKLTDGNVRSCWEYSKREAYVGVHIPNDREAGWLRIEWMFDPTGFELIEYDAGREVLRIRNQDDTFPNIYTVFDLLPETKYIQLLMTAMGQQICTLAVYSSGTPPEGLQIWQPPVQKADLMVVSAHQDDELIFLGGTIPYYAVAFQRPTVVMYMANCTRYRRAEALNALWKMGVRNYPQFLNLPDGHSKTMEAGLKKWGGKDHLLELVAEQIRRYQPEVIVTQDLNGEYGHDQHKLTAYAMMPAIEAAADPNQYPESALRYGAWQVKKLYHHLYNKHRIKMDWNTKLAGLGGKSALRMARIGMQEQASQLKYYNVKKGGKYDNAKFGLFFSTVGEDVAKNDFLEHTDGAITAEEIAAGVGDPDDDEEDDEDSNWEDALTPEMTDSEETDPGQVMPEESDAEEEAMDDPDAEAPTQAEQAGLEAQTPVPTAEPQTANERSGAPGVGVVLGIVAGVGAVGAAGWLLYRRSRQSRRRHRRRR